MASLAQNLFRTATVIYALSIPGHTNTGFQLVYPAIATISTSTEKNTQGKRCAQEGWTYMNASFLIAGMSNSTSSFHGSLLTVLAVLNWQWSRMLGPKTTEEMVMMWTLSVGGAFSGYRFAQVGLYPPLLCMFGAPICTLAGWWLSR